MKQGRRVKRKAFLVGIVSRWGAFSTLARLLNQEMTITCQFGFDYDLKIYVFFRGSGCANYNRPGVYTRFVLPSSCIIPVTLNTRVTNDAIQTKNILFRISYWLPWIRQHMDSGSCEIGQWNLSHLILIKSLLWWTQLVKSICAINWEAIFHPNLLLFCCILAAPTQWGWMTVIAQIGKKRISQHGKS